MDIPRTPLTLAQWAQQTADRSGLNSNIRPSTILRIDPKIHQERQQQLKLAFQRMDKDQSGTLTLQEILSYLNKISDDVDQEYVQTICDALDRNRDGVIQIDEFVNGYLEQVAGVTEAIARLKQLLMEKQRKLGNIKEQLAEAETTERLNSWGVMDGSTLNVRVHEAQNLPSKYAAQVELSCEKQKIRTSVSQQSRNPEWDESFQFNITMGTGEFLIVLLSISRMGLEGVLGKCSIKLQDFRDQQVHEQWYALESDTAECRLLLTTQWIHSKRVLYSQQIKEIQDSVSRDQAEISRMEAELRKLGANPLGMFQKETLADRIETRIVATAQSISHQYFPHVSNWVQIWRILLAIISFLVVIAQFQRTDMINIT